MSFRVPHRSILVYSCALAGLGIAGCLGDDRHPVAVVEDPQLSSHAYLSYYEADIQQIFHGGYDGFDQPTAARERTHHLVRQNQNGFWSVDQTYASAEAPMGEPVALDVARVAFVAPGDLTVTTRWGQVLTAPDTASLGAGMKRANPNDPFNPWGVGIMPAMQAPSFTTANGPVSTAGGFRGRAGAPDRIVVGPEARQRVLERLQRDYAPLPRAAGRQRFERVSGERRLLIEVDDITGAVVREEVREGGRRISETTREYRIAGGASILAREVTVVFDGSGAPSQRFEHTVSNLRTERSR